MKRINANITNEAHAKIVGYKKRKKLHSLDDALNGFIIEARTSDRTPKPTPEERLKEMEDKLLKRAFQPELDIDETARTMKAPPGLTPSQEAMWREQWRKAMHKRKPVFEDTRMIG